MEKREDCWWRESTLGEDGDVKVGTYLRANHQEYQEIRHQIDELIQQYPAVRALFESEDAVTLTAEEHKALIRYFCLESSVEMIEREYHFYMGQSMMYSYGTMLTSIRNSVLGENVEPAGYLTDHLLDLIAESRTDELEDEFQEKSQKYRDAIQEVTQCENAIHELGLSKEAKKTIDRYVSAVGHRWVLCGDYLYKAGMRDILRLLENR